MHTVKSFEGVEVYALELLALTPSGRNLEAAVPGCHDSGEVLTLG
jgi:hypothetical protein